MIIHKITWGCMQDYFFNIWCFGRCWSPWSYATIVSFKVSKTIHSRRSHCKVCKSRKFSLVVKFQKQIHNPMKKLHLRCLVGSEYGSELAFTNLKREYTGKCSHILCIANVIERKFRVLYILTCACYCYFSKTGGFMFSIDFPYIGSIFEFLCTKPLQLETDVTMYWLYNDAYSITHQIENGVQCYKSK